MEALTLSKEWMRSGWGVGREEWMGNGWEGMGRGEREGTEIGM